MASMKTGLIIGVAIAGVAAAALAGSGARWTPPGSLVAGRGLALTPVSTATVFSPPPGAPLSFADIFERVSPAVVSIDVTSHLDARALRQIPGFENFPFKLNPNPRGGGGGGGEGDDNNNAQGPKAQSSGSGFFISANGYVVTNNHVVENADDIKVTLKDGRQLPAKVIGHDEDTDLAVIKVEGSGFPFVDFENSAKPRVGDWVIAVGNPFGLGGTATAGIVSALARENISESSFVDFIQIDAPINRGNSGGPTFDIYGRVIGVNSAIFSPSGGSVGIGFAIPADVADDITKRLIEGGKVTRGYLGANIQNVTPDIAESLGSHDLKGALVADLVKGGPAQKAGVQSGDVVTQLNGHPVTSSTELTRLVAHEQPGAVLHLTVLRNGKPQMVDVRSGTRPPPTQLAANGGGEDEGGPAAPGASHGEQSALGMSLGVIDDATRRKLDLPADVHGVLVLGVKSSSDAGDQGLKAGDIIVRAGDSEVASPTDVTEAVVHYKKEGRMSMLVGVRRDGVTRYVPIKIEK